jgi:hypothetical protein
VDHLIKLHPEYAEASDNLDTNKLWIILRQSVNQHGTFNASEIKIEWANYKQSTFNAQRNILSTIPLGEIPLSISIMLIISEAILSILPTSNARRLFLPILMSDDIIHMSGTSITAPHLKINKYL